jgi:hypothetical protein
MTVYSFKIIRFVALVVAIVSFMQVIKNNYSIIFGVVGIIAISIIIYLNVANKKS